MQTKDVIRLVRSFSELESITSTAGFSVKGMVGKQHLAEENRFKEQQRVN